MWELDRITATKTARLANECHQKFHLSNDVKQAIANTNREKFVPTGFKHNAYKLDALPVVIRQQFFRTSFVVSLLLSVSSH